MKVLRVGIVAAVLIATVGIISLIDDYHPSRANPEIMASPGPRLLACLPTDEIVELTATISTRGGTAESAEQALERFLSVTVPNLPRSEFTQTLLKDDYAQFTIRVLEADQIVVVAQKINVGWAVTDMWACGSALAAHSVEN